MAIKVFADGANLEGMLDMYENGNVQGFTTNPSLMKKGGVTDYRAFAKEVLAHITDVSVSFEVFADDVETMEVEAREIATWAENVYVKIPCVTTKGESTAELVRKLSADGIKVNVTTIFTPEQCPTASWPSVRTSAVTRMRSRSIPCAVLPRISPRLVSISCRNANAGYIAGCSPRPFLSLSLTRFARVALGKGKAGAADTNLPVGW